MLFDLVQVFALFSGMLLASGAGAPIPEELTLVFAGIWCASHPEYDPFRWLVLPVCILSSVVADSVLYATGRFCGEKIHKGQFKLLGLTHSMRHKMERLFQKWGIGLLVVGRLIPVFRLPLFLTAGLMRMPLSRFALADLIGAGIANSVFFLLAFWLGDKFRDDLDFVLRQVKPFLLGSLVLILVGWGLWALWKLSTKNKEEDSDPEMDLEAQPRVTEVSAHPTLAIPQSPVETRIHAGPIPQPLKETG